MLGDSPTLALDINVARRRPKQGTRGRIGKRIR